MRFKTNKKGIAGIGLLVTIFAIIGVVGSIFWIAGIMSDKGTGLSVTPVSSQSPATVPNVAIQGLTFTEDVTVTFSSFDMFSKGTSAGTAHRILQLDGTTSSIVADDSTLQKSPGNNYLVLLGNETDASTITAGTDYYPRLVRGTLPDLGTFTVGTATGDSTNANYGGQAMVGDADNVVFTFFNENDQVNTAQALGASDADTKMRWKLVANDNICVGNIDTYTQTTKPNLMSYMYNTTVFNTVVQLDATGNDQTARDTPTSVGVRTGHVTRSYEFPIVCDNQEISRKVRLATAATQPAANQHDINMTISDISCYVNDDTLEPIAGYADEDSNDIGVADFIIGSLVVS